MEGCGCPDEVCAFEEYMAAIMKAREEGEPTPQVIMPGGIDSEERVMEE